MNLTREKTPKKNKATKTERTRDKKKSRLKLRKKDEASAKVQDIIESTPVSEEIDKAVIVSSDAQEESVQEVSKLSNDAAPLVDTQEEEDDSMPPLDDEGDEKSSGSDSVYAPTDEDKSNETSMTEEELTLISAIQNLLDFADSVKLSSENEGFDISSLEDSEVVGDSVEKQEEGDTILFRKKQADSDDSDALPINEDNPFGDEEDTSEEKASFEEQSQDTTSYNEDGTVTEVTVVPPPEFEEVDDEDSEEIEVKERHGLFSRRKRFPKDEIIDDEELEEDDEEEKEPYSDVDDEGDEDLISSNSNSQSGGVKDIILSLLEVSIAGAVLAIIGYQLGGIYITSMVSHVLGG